MKSRSARCYVFACITGMAVIIVVSYTFLLRHYFIEGLDLSMAYNLEVEARDFAGAYRGNPDTPLPKARFMTSYIGLETLPAHILEHFPENTHTAGKSLREYWWPEGADRSDEEQMHILFLLPFDLHDGQRLYLFRDITPAHAAEPLAPGAVLSGVFGVGHHSDDSAYAKAGGSPGQLGRFPDSGKQE